MPVRTAIVPLLGLACTLVCALPARALDVSLTGYDRNRFYVFDTLSLDRDADTSEGACAYFEQRLRLEPHLQINPHIHVFGQIDLLDMQVYGTDAGVYADFWADQSDASLGDAAQLSDDNPPIGDDYRTNAIVRRVWGEIWTPYVDLRFGRMGNHWGMGLLANDGNDVLADHGDSVDRVQVRARLGPVQLSLAFDTFLEGWINEKDDVWGLTFTGGFLSDVHSVGLYVHWRRMPSQSWNSIYADLWGRTRLGPIYAELEAVFQYGKGNFDDEFTSLSIYDQEVLAGGGAFLAGIEVLPFGGEVQVGLATGDKDAEDSIHRTFTLDRDHNVALLMFEEPMPSFRAGSDPDQTGIDESLVVTPEGVSNAFYIKPGVFIDPLDNLRLRLDMIAARRLVKPDPELEPDDLHIGIEVDFDVSWTLYENFELGARVGVLFPGPIYEPHRDVVFGSELRGIIRF